MRPHVVHWLEGVFPGGLAAAVAPTWFTCVGLAGVVTLLAMLAIARRHRIDPRAMAGLVAWCYAAAVISGIAVPSAIDAAEQLVATGRVELRWAGMTSFWGYLTGGCAVAMVCRAHGLALGRVADLAAAPLGVALALSRLGCFLAGCDYGKVTAVPWAVRFPAHSPAWQDHVRAGLIGAGRAESLPVHPTQLYEAALGLAIAVVALGVARRRWVRDGRGRGFLVTAAMYAIGRIAIEELRGDLGRGIYLGLSSGEIFSIAVLAAIAVGCLRRSQTVTAITAAAGALALAMATDAHAQPARPPRQPASQPRPSASPSGQPAPSSGQPAPTPRQPFGPALPPPPRQPAAPSGQSAPQPRPSASPSSQPAPAPGQPFGPALPPPSAQPQPGPAPAQPPPTSPPNSGGARPPVAAPAPAAAGAEPAAAMSFELGALAGFAAPFNRRRDQVATLGGGSVSLGFGWRQLGVWLDVDSLGNLDASHGTILLSGSMLGRASDRLAIGGRVGVGATLVNFDDPAFRDVAGTTVRFEALIDYRLGTSWAVWLRPLSFDILSAADLGGPIATWQARIGVGYRFAVGHRAASPPAATPPGAPAAPYPAQPPYPAPPAPYPPQPAPYPAQPPYPAPPAPYPPQPAPYPPPPAQPAAPSSPRSR